MSTTAQVAVHGLVDVPDHNPLIVRVSRPLVALTTVFHKEGFGGCIWIAESVCDVSFRWQAGSFEFCGSDVGDFCPANDVLEIGVQGRRGFAIVKVVSRTHQAVSTHAFTGGKLRVNIGIVENEVAILVAESADDR